MLLLNLLLWHIFYWFYTFTFFILQLSSVFYDCKSVFSFHFKNLPQGAVENTFGMFCMTSDEADGEVGYDQQTKQVYVKWNNEHHQRFYFSAKAGLEEAIGSLGGNMGLTPKFSGQLDSDAISRHPLGGCPMGETGTYGVVNHTGAVFIGMSLLLKINSI